MFGWFRNFQYQWMNHDALAMSSLITRNAVQKKDGLVETRLRKTIASVSARVFWVNWGFLYWCPREHQNGRVEAETTDQTAAQFCPPHFFTQNAKEEARGTMLHKGRHSKHIFNISDNFESYFASFVAFGGEEQPQQESDRGSTHGSVAGLRNGYGRCFCLFYRSK